jgi:Fur family transcriptional regulator, ferric uptake regulator
MRIIRKKGNTPDMVNLKAKGYRDTLPRREVLRALGAGALTPQEIVETLRARGSQVDQATVYRTLDLFAELGIVNKLKLGGRSAKYEIAGRSADHHHHLQCERCGGLTCVPLDCDPLVERMAAAIENSHFFKVNSHSLEFFGLCGACRSNSKGGGGA